MTELVPVADTRLQIIDRPVGLDDIQVHLVDDADTAAEFMRWLSTRDVVGFDTESTGLDKDVDRPRMVQYGDDRVGWAIPIENMGWGGLVVDAVTRYEGVYTMHNAPFDCAMMDRVGVKIPKQRVRNTRIMAHVLSSTEPLALKYLSCKYVDPRAGAAQIKLDEAIGKSGGWTWATVPVTFTPYWAYGAIDPVLTYQLDQYLYPRVMNEAPRSYDLEVAVEWVCEKMSRRGTRVDRDYITQFSNSLTQFIDSADEWCHTVYGVHPTRGSQVIAALQHEGIEFVKTTKGGAISLDKEVLADIVAQYGHPLAQTVLNRRRAYMTRGTYLDNYLKFSERDGLIHPSINTVGGTDKNPFEPGGSGRGVRTGRMSMSDPNLQNVPKRTVFGDRIRDAFVGRDLHTWVKADFDQIEMRLLAHFSRDPGMIAAFIAEGDFFVNMAREIFQDPTITKSDKRRQPVKNSGYAKIYGAGLEQFARTANMRLPDGKLDINGAAAFLRRFDELYPGAARMSRNVENMARQTLANEGEAYVRSPLTGRKHRADQSRMYALVNYLIQGAAGEVMKLKIVEADAAGLSEFMLFPVHDEIDMDVPNDQLDDVVHTLSNVMNDATLLNVPITASIETGQRWGTLTELATAA